MGIAVSNYGYNWFSISMVNKKFLKANGIQMSVKDFKKYILTQPNEVVKTGGIYQIKHCKVWNIETIKNNLKEERKNKNEC